MLGNCFRVIRSAVTKANDIRRGEQYEARASLLLLLNNLKLIGKSRVERLNNMRGHVLMSSVGTIEVVKTREEALRRPNKKLCSNG